MDGLNFASQTRLSVEEKEREHKQLESSKA